MDAEALRRLVDLADAGADSPPETALRLVASQVRAGLSTQIVIYDVFGRITSADCGWKDLKVALFYDGSHHLQRQQRDYDSELNARLPELGWRYLRVTHGMLKDPLRLQKRIRAMIVSATRERRRT